MTNTSGKFNRYQETNTSSGKINTLLSDLLEKEEEIALYKDRLKELEAAFYYNLEVIAERDLEISVLEKQLCCDRDRLQSIIRERDELEDLVKIIDEKKNRKIHQLEAKLAVKEDEIQELQKDNVSSVNALKRIIDNLKTQRDEKVCKLNNRYELQKKELIKRFEEEMDEKEKHYLLEIDNLKEKLEQAQKGKEALSYFENEYKNLKSQLEEVEKLFQEKENYYLEELRKNSKTQIQQFTRSIQCELKDQGIDKNAQAVPNRRAAECQTKLAEVEEEYKKKVDFLQEQNEVLKCVIKEMKRSQSETKLEETPSGCECLEMVKKVNKRFEDEIFDIKKILEEEKRQRREEEVVLQSLETSVTCLKEKLLTELQKKLQRCSGEGDCNSLCKLDIQNEIQVTLLEEKLSQKIDTLVTSAREEQHKLLVEFEEFKKECFEKMENYLKSKDEIKSENILEKIRMEIHNLENKIESDMKNIVGNNFDKKYEKNLEPRVEFEGKEIPFLNPETLLGDPFSLGTIRGVYYRNDLVSDKRGKTLKGRKVKNKFRNDLAVR